MIKRLTLILVFFLINLSIQGRALMLCLSHFGNNKTEKIRLIEVKEVPRNPQPQFSKPYGYYKLSIEKNGKEVYFTYFNSLFYEYSTTKNEKIKKFEECFFVPLFKPPFKVKVSKLNRVIFSKTVEKTKKEQNSPKIKTKIKGKIKIGFIADGFALKQDFLSDIRKLKKEFLSYKPYSKYKNLFVFEPIFVKNRTFTNKNTFGMKRYITVSKLKEIYQLLEKNDCDFFVVVVNSKKYGGSGILNNFCCVTSKNKLSGFVFVHEFGHYFAGLGDEYFTSKTTYNEFYPKNFEPLEPNLTRKTKLSQIKWKDLISKDTPIPTPPVEKYKGKVGLFEGGGYLAKGIYRPQLHCIMKDRGYKSFCKVCEKAIEERIKSLINSR